MVGSASGRFPAREVCEDASTTNKGAEVADAVKERIIVRSPLDRVYDVISDFAAYPEWQDEINDVEILETDGQGRGKRVRFAIDAKVIRANFVLVYSYADVAMRWHLVEGDQLRRNDGVYELSDRGDGTTEVLYELEIEPSVALPGIIKRRIAKRIVDSALKGMKGRVESLD